MRRATVGTWHNIGRPFAVSNREGRSVIPKAWAVATVLALTACGGSEPAVVDDPDAPLRAAFEGILADGQLRVVRRSRELSRQW